MRVLRHRQFLGCLAMLVFAMQGILAFAHTHTHSYPRVGLERLAARAITYGMCKPGQETPCRPAVPHKDHGKCEICWSMAMASTGVLQPPPLIVPREPLFVLIEPDRIARLIGGEAHRHFQARAPPLA